MSKGVFKNLLLVFTLILLISLIWILNQKKNYNPVFSLKTNLTYRTNKNLNYNDLSSTYEILKLLKKQYPAFSLVPAVKNRDFSVIGRVLKTKNDEVSVFEYSDNAAAKKDAERLSSNYGTRMLTYKNLVILTGSENEVLSYLKESLK